MGNPFKGWNLRSREKIPTGSNKAKKRNSSKAKNSSSSQKKSRFGAFTFKRTKSRRKPTADLPVFSGKPAAKSSGTPSGTTSRNLPNTYPSHSEHQRGRQPRGAEYRDTKSSRTADSSRVSHRAAPVSSAFASAVSGPNASQSQSSRSVPGTRPSSRAPSVPASFASSASTLTSQPPKSSKTWPEARSAKQAGSASASHHPTGARSWHSFPSHASGNSEPKPEMLSTESTMAFLRGTTPRQRAQHRSGSEPPGRRTPLPRSNLKSRSVTTLSQDYRQNARNPAPPVRIIKRPCAFHELQNRDALCTHSSYTLRLDQAPNEFLARKLFDMQGEHFHYLCDFRERLDVMGVHFKDAQLIDLLMDKYGVYVTKNPNLRARQLLKLRGDMVSPNGDGDVPPPPP